MNINKNLDNNYYGYLISSEIKFYHLKIKFTSHKCNI